LTKPIKDKKRGSPKRTAKRLLLFLIVAVVAFSAYANRSRLSFSGITEWVNEISLSGQNGDGYPVSISGLKVSDLCEFNGFTALLTDTAFVAYNKNGNESLNIQHGFASPSVSASAGRSLIYDVGGFGFRIDSISKNIYIEKLEQMIISAEISKSGSYIIATRSKGALGELAVFDSEKNQKYRWFSDEASIIDVSLNDKGDRAAAAVLETKGGEIVSSVLLFQYSKKEPLAKFEFKGSLINNICFVGETTIACVSDNKFITVKGPNKEDVSETGYDGKYLSGFSLRKGTGTAVLLSDNPDLKEPSLCLFDTGGTKKFSVDNSDNIRYVYLGDRDVYLLKDNEAVGYSVSGGEKTKTVKTADDSDRICITGDALMIQGIGELNSSSLK